MLEPNDVRYEPTIAPILRSIPGGPSRISHSLRQFAFQPRANAVDRLGIVDLEELSVALRETMLVASLTHANNETGVIQPVVAMIAVSFCEPVSAGQLRAT